MFMMLMLLFLIEPEIVESIHQHVAESEDSEDEWNYVKIEKKGPEGLTSVEEAQEVESPIVEQPKVVAEEEVIPVSLDNEFSRPKTKFNTLIFILVV